MIGLTDRQAQLLTFIECELLDRQVCPSYSEMAAHMGLKSKGHIQKMLQNLEQRGYVRLIKNLRRSIELIDQHAPLCHHCGHAYGSAPCRKAAANKVSYSNSAPSRACEAEGVDSPISERCVSAGGDQIPRPI